MKISVLMVVTTLVLAPGLVLAGHTPGQNESGRPNYENQSEKAVAAVVALDAMLSTGIWYGSGKEVPFAKIFAFGFVGGIVGVQSAENDYRTQTTYGEVGTLVGTIGTAVIDIMVREGFDLSWESAPQNMFVGVRPIPNGGVLQTRFNF